MSDLGESSDSDSGISNVRPPPRDVSFALTCDEWNTIKPEPTVGPDPRNRISFKTEYTDVMRNHLRDTNKHCVLIGDRMYCHGERKGARGPKPDAYACATLKCNDKDCGIIYTLRINRMPGSNESPQVTGSYKGIFNHRRIRAGAVNIRREQMRGAKKKQISRDMAASKVGVSEFAQQRGTKIHPLSASTGNLTGADTVQALYKLKSREKLSTRLDENPKISILKYVERLEPDYLIGDDKLDKAIGLTFVKDLGIMPLNFTMMYNQQLRMAVDMFKQCKTTLHIDATGSLMKRFKSPGDHRPLTYSIIPSYPKDVPYKGEMFPIAEWASTVHNVPDIQHFFAKFNWYKDQLSKKAHPESIVVDWSYALLHAVSGGFNGMKLADYSNFCHKLITGKLTQKQIDEISYIHLCSAHFLHMAGRRTRQLKTLKTSRYYFMHYISALITCTDYKELLELIRCGSLVFGSEFTNSTIDKASKRLAMVVSKKKGEKLWDEKNERPYAEVPEGVQELFDDDELTSRFDAFKESSLFWMECKEVLKATEPLKAKDGAEPNLDYNPGFMALLSSWLPHLHLWSGITFSPERYAKDISQEERDCVVIDTNHLTNAPVESWNHKAKTSSLGGMENLEAPAYCEKMRVSIGSSLDVMKQVALAGAAYHKLARKQFRRKTEPESQEEPTDTAVSASATEDAATEMDDASTASEGWNKKKPQKRKQSLYFTATSGPLRNAPPEEDIEPFKEKKQKVTFAPAFMSPSKKARTPKKAQRKASQKSERRATTESSRTPVKRQIFPSTSGQPNLDRVADFESFSIGETVEIAVADIQQQLEKSVASGIYAAANAIALSMGVNPSTLKWPSERRLRSSFSAFARLSNPRTDDAEKFMLCAGTRLPVGKKVLETVSDTVFCAKCHTVRHRRSLPGSQATISCDTCNKWFHYECADAPAAVHHVKEAFFVCEKCVISGKMPKCWSTSEIKNKIASPTEFVAGNETITPEMQMALLDGSRIQAPVVNAYAKCLTSLVTSISAGTTDLLALHKELFLEKRMGEHLKLDEIAERRQKQLSKWLTGSACKLALLPVFTNDWGGHFYLLALDMDNHVINIYNSASHLGETFAEGLDSILESLHEMYKEYEFQLQLMLTMLKMAFPSESWDVVHRPVPQQRNSVDCGIFVCNFMKCLAHNIAPCYGQDFIKYFRQYMARELITGTCVPQATEAEITDTKIERTRIAKKGMETKSDNKEDTGSISSTGGGQQNVDWIRYYSMLLNTKEVLSMWKIVYPLAVVKSRAETGSSTTQ